MTEPTYSYEPARNTNVADDFMAISRVIKNELDKMHTELQVSLRTWQSPSSKVAYESRKARWDEAANSMPVSLQAASQTLQNITSQMNNTERAITQSWS